MQTGNCGNTGKMGGLAWYADFLSEARFKASSPLGFGGLSRTKPLGDVFFCPMTGQKGSFTGSKS
jgi:hypothetical protein